MATVKQTIGEIDYVEFMEAIDKVEGTGKWPAGTRGTVVHDLGDHKMVEISNDRGEDLDFPVVPEEKLELVTKHSNQIADSPTDAPGTTKKRLHKLVDELSECEAKRVLGLLEQEREDPTIAV